MGSKAQRDGRMLGESKLRSYFLLFVGKSTPDCVRTAREALQSARPFSCWW